MKYETITKAVKVINRSIRFYQRKLIFQLELRAEVKLNNGNLDVTSLGDYESNIQKYEIILADLATIKRAINNNKESCRLIGAAEGFPGMAYVETLEALKETKLEYDGDGFGEIWFFDNIEWAE